MQQIPISAGFYVVAFIWILLVGVPSAISVSRNFRFGGARRLGAVLFGFLLLFLVSTGFIAEDGPISLESSLVFGFAVSAFVIWPMFLFASLIEAISSRRRHRVELNKTENG
jgi:hypothetical protein